MNQTFLTHEGFKSKNFAADDILVHPDKPWPWIGIVRVDLIVQVCTKCDLVVGYAIVGSSPDTSLKCQQCQQQSDIELFFQSDDYKSYVHIGEKASAHPYLQSIGLNASESAQKDTKSFSRLFHMVLWPTGEKISLSGSEKVVQKFSAHAAYLENVAVQSKLTKLYGLVKRVRRTADMFILPKNEYIISSVDVAKLESTRPLDCGNAFVIHDGLIGRVMEFMRRVHFRLAEGNELCAEYVDFMLFMKHESPSEFNRWQDHRPELVPGETVKISLPLIDRAVFPDEKASNIWDMFEKRRFMMGKAGEILNSKNTENVKAMVERFFGEKLSSMRALLGQNEDFTNNKKANACNAERSDPTPAEDIILEATFVRVEVYGIAVRWIHEISADKTMPECLDKLFMTGDSDLRDAVFVRNKTITDFMCLDSTHFYSPPVDFSSVKILPAEKWRQNLFTPGPLEAEYLTGHALNSVIKEASRNSRANTENMFKREGTSDAILRTSPACCRVKLDVMWENGQIECGVDPESVTCKLNDSYLSEREFYPAMYVYLPKSAGRYLLDWRQSCSGNGTESDRSLSNVNVEQNFGENCQTSKSVLLHKRNHFGIVRKADNAQKIATIDIYSFERDLYVEACKKLDFATINQLEPRLWAEEQNVSFYQLRSYSDYNYYAGCLVIRLLPSASGENVKVGCVDRKNPDGTVTVSWYPDASAGDIEDMKISKTEVMEQEASMNSSHNPDQPMTSCFLDRQDEISATSGSAKPDVLSAMRWAVECCIEKVQPWHINQLCMKASYYDPLFDSISSVDPQGIANGHLCDEYQTYDQSYCETVDDDDESMMSDGSNTPRKNKLYSPTDHELAEFEDHYYAFSSMPVATQCKRMSLVVSIWSRIIIRLVHSIILIRRKPPNATVDRKRVVKAVASLHDAASSMLANLEGFWADKNVEHLVNEEEAVLAEYNNSVNKHTADYLRFSKINNGRIIWTCADRLYDFCDVISLLCQDLIGFKPKRRSGMDDIGDGSDTKLPGNDPSLVQFLPNGDISADEMSHREAEVGRKVSQRKISVVIADKDSFNTQLQDQIAEIEKDAEEEPLNAVPSVTDNDKFMVDEIDLYAMQISTGLALVSAIIATPTKVDVTGDAVLDYLSSCDTKKCVTELSSPTDQLVDYTLSVKFLLIIAANFSKANHLPCFNTAVKSHDELCNLHKAWNNPEPQETALKSTAQQLVQRTYDFLRDFFDRKRTISYRTDDILRICNDIGDSLCLCILSIIYRLVEVSVIRLKPYFDEVISSVKLDKPQAMQCECEQISPVDQLLCSVLDKLDDDLQLKPRDIEEAQTSEQDLIAATTNQFEFLSDAPETHRFIQKPPPNPALISKAFLQAVRRDIRLLSSCLPPGIFVKAYETRMDLLSCMIVGPSGTPYAEGLFFFDVRLHENYPVKPPHVFFKSMSKLLNPNLYEDGMVCLSLLGTWNGKETELWNSSSTLLQVFVSIQSLILVPEPYFNEPGFEQERGTGSGSSKSREYNESAVLRTLESLKRILCSPPEPFRLEIVAHVKDCRSRFGELMDYYQRTDCASPGSSCHDFPLFPTTQGFSLCVKALADSLLLSMDKLLTCDDS